MLILKIIKSSRIESVARSLITSNKDTYGSIESYLHLADFYKTPIIIKAKIYALKHMKQQLMKV
jgi:hypothetical protein